MNYADLATEQIDWRGMAELTLMSVKHEMEAENVGALLTCTPDNWRYVTGIPVHTGLAYYSRTSVWFQVIVTTRSCCHSAISRSTSRVSHHGFRIFALSPLKGRVRHGSRSGREAGWTSLPEL
jgi:hypothetical protein